MEFKFGDKIETSSQLSYCALHVANNMKTLYVMGAFGFPMDDYNKKRVVKSQEYNNKPERLSKISSSSFDTFGFDCVCFIKGLLWGFNGNVNDHNGGSKYKSNDVPDLTVDGMLKACSDISDNMDPSNIEVGELLWMKGHVGLYVGEGLVVECTPSNDSSTLYDGVQVRGLLKKVGDYKASNKFTKHGKLPYISYDVGVKESVATLVPMASYISTSGVYIRSDAGMSNKKIGYVVKGDKVLCDGTFKTVGGSSSLWIKIKSGDLIGYSSLNWYRIDKSSLRVGVPIVLNKKISRYNTSNDAIKHRGSIGQYEQGRYYVYKIASNGMVNITRDSTAKTPGSWVDL